jgi:hypothetical protein
MKNQRASLSTEVPKPVEFLGCPIPVMRKIRGWGIFATEPESMLIISFVSALQVLGFVGKGSPGKNYLSVRDI